MEQLSPNEHSARLYDIVVRGDLGRVGPDLALRRFRPSGFDAELLAVADAAVDLRVPTALVFPIVGTTTGVLLSAAMLVARFARTHILNAQIALVTKQLKLRSFFDTLHFRKERIAHYFPRTVVASDGTVADLGVRLPQFAGKPGRLHFVSNIEGLGTKLTSRLAGLVVEAHPSYERALHQLVPAMAGRVPVIYLAQNPADPLIELFVKVGAVWAWDTSALRTLVEDEENPDYVCADPVLLRASWHTCYEIAGPNETTPLDTILASLWNNLVAIQHHPGSLGFEAVGWVWGVFGALSHLAVPVESYDRSARVAWATTPLVDAPRKAEVYARNTLRPEDREYWQRIANDLDAAVQVARTSNPKPRGLVEWVRRRVECGDAESLVVVRNRASIKAATGFLQEHPEVPLGWDRLIRITSFPDLASARSQMATGEVLYTGPVVSSYAGLLALPTAKRLTILAHGPWEALRTVRQIQGATERLANLAHGDVRTRAVERLFPGRKISENLDPVPVRLQRTGLSLPAGVPSAARKAVWSPFDIRIARQLGRADLDSDGPASHGMRGQREEVEVLFVRFEDGIGFFEPSHIVSRLSDGELGESAAKALSAGDRVILVERGARQDLFGSIVDKLERLPEFEATVMLIREWHERAGRAGCESGLSAAEILRRMGPDASISSPQTIATWVRGLVHGPLRAEDIRLFGQAVGDQFLQTRWEAVGRALATIRAHRRRVGHMLAKVLNGVAAADLEDAGYFDRRLGIHFSDLTEALSVHVVRERKEGSVVIGYQYANRLLTEEEEERIDSIYQDASP